MLQAGIKAGNININVKGKVSVYERVACVYLWCVCALDVCVAPLCCALCCAVLSMLCAVLSVLCYDEELMYQLVL